MKNEYKKPELEVSAYEEFEKVYAGYYCSKEADISGCKREYDPEVSSPAMFATNS